MKLNRFFVYGTLRQGNCRAGRWPHSAVSIESAWIRGSLYDGPGYPALGPGNDKIKGELWSFRDEHVASVVQVLDKIEGTHQPGMPNLYDRVVIEVFDCNDQPTGRAWTYQYAEDPIASGFTPIEASESGGAVDWHEC